MNSAAYSRKSSGRLRICLDPKDLNRAIKRNHHVTPTLEELTHKFAGSTIFSKVDARHEYWSVALDEESSMLTTFNSPFGRYRYLRMPFGLRMSQDVFQQKMDQILESCPGCIGIADDVAVFGRNAEEHDKNLHNLLQVARQHGLVFNADKCEIKQERIKFFGLYFDKEEFTQILRKLQTSKTWRHPRMQKDYNCSWVSLHTCRRSYLISHNTQLIYGN